jgi:hypothetical protein
MELPAELKEKVEELKTLSLKTIEDKIGPFLAHVISKTPGLLIPVEKGCMSGSKRVRIVQSFWKPYLPKVGHGTHQQVIRVAMSCHFYIGG